MTPSRAAAVLALAAAAACGGETGTIRIDVVAAPGSDLIDRIERARVTLSHPSEVIEAERDESGELHLDLEVTADGSGGFLELEGFDADDQRIALGLSPPLPISAIDAAIALYVGPPGAFAEAPVSLDPPRSAIGAAELTYGAVLAGGRDADGDPVGELAIYNIYDHQLQVGDDLPAPRAAPTVMTGETDYVYILGGEDAEGAPQGDAWRFDTTVAPAGAYLQIATPAEAARAGQSGLYAGNQVFLVAGDPALAISEITLQAVVIEDAPSLEDGVGVLVSGAPIYPIFVAGAGVSETGAVLFQAGQFADLDVPPTAQRRGHGVVRLPDARVLVVGGEAPDGTLLRGGVVYDPVTDDADDLPDLLAQARRGAAIAGSFDLVVVAGGADGDGALIGNAEIFDGRTLEHLDTVPLVVPRTGAVLLPLANGQFLLAGGTGADGAPVGTLELFTPDL